MERNDQLEHKPSVGRMPVIVRAKAPLRISFCGGGTDVPPYPAAYGGCVLSCTISKYAFASVVARRDGAYKIESLDYGLDVRYGSEQALTFNGELDLVKAVIRRFRSKRGAELFLHSDAPPGSGLGSSSTMVVALVCALAEYMGRVMSEYEVAEAAYMIERADLGIPGGYQDQYAAAFGGFNFIEFYGDRVVVNPLRVAPAVLDELRYNMLLCFTGTARTSTAILAQQTARVEDEDEAVLGVLASLKKHSIAMKEALLRGRLGDFGELLDAAWKAKRLLADGVSTPVVENLYEVAKRHGAIGGKLLGAGGGGYLLLYCEPRRTHAVAEQLTRAGGQVVDFAFEPEGARFWRPSR